MRVNNFIDNIAFSLYNIIVEKLLFENLWRKC